MSESTKKRILLIYTCALGILLIAVGVLFVVSCVNIYNLGDRPFTRENISSAFSKIAVPVYIAIAAVVIGGIGKIWLDTDEKKKNKPRVKDTLAILKKRLASVEAAPESAQKIKREELCRRLIWIGAAVLLALSLIYPLIFIFSPATFPADNVNTANASVADAMIILGASLALPTAYSVAALFVAESSMKRECELIRAALTSNTANAAREAEENKKSALSSFFEKHGRVISISAKCTVVVVGVVFVILGISNGGMADVLAKAVKICTECIGLG
ncbi:MAG: hypothetical protein IJ515_03685 [Clostridia bacterium]|nr:hypothetical protein [Clostridia bacterium]